MYSSVPIGGSEAGWVGILLAAEPDDHGQGGDGDQPGRPGHRVVDAARRPGQVVRGGRQDGAGQRGDSHRQPQTKEGDAGQDIQDV